MLPYEVVSLIIKYVIDLPDFLKMRLWNKQFSKDCLRYWHAMDFEYRLPRATMIPVSLCMFCEKEGEMKQSQVLKDAYPRRIFVHCNSLKCCHATVQSMKQVICDVDECRIVQNWQRFMPKTITIRRSSGAMQEAQPFPFYLFLLHNKVLVRVDFTDKNMECCKLIAYEAFKIEEPKVIVF
tara:strand:+ start:3722 stop:4264 length:543 start_codon:yes stop_codon:yes gene_type:complete